MKEIYIIRHGETDWNNKGLSQGSRNNIKLNKNGKEQAKKTGKYLNKFRQIDSNFDVILSSPMDRAKQTAEIIAKEIGYDKNNILYVDELIENDLGLLSIGKTKDELKKDDFYDDYFNLIDTIENIKDKVEKLLYEEKNKKMIDKILKKYEIENEETVYKRIKKLLKMIDKFKYNKILIVTHSGFIADLNRYILNTYDYIRGDMSNGSNCNITLYHYNKKKYKLVMAPNTLHLK